LAGIYFHQPERDESQSHRDIAIACSVALEIAMNTNTKQFVCHICRRLLDQPEDPLSQDCGGDCWGCVGEIEADGGDPESLAKVRQEAAVGLRPGWTDPGD
jgi:hypothetical protein